MMEGLSLVNSLWYLSHIIIYIGNLSRFTLEFVTQPIKYLVFVTFSVIYVCYLSRFQWVFVPPLLGVCHESLLQYTVFQYVIKILVLMFLENHSNQRETQRNNPHYKCGCSYSFF